VQSACVRGLASNHSSAVSVAGISEPRSGIHERCSYLHLLPQLEALDLIVGKFAKHHPLRARCSSPRSWEKGPWRGLASAQTGVSSCMRTQDAQRIGRQLRAGGKVSRFADWVTATDDRSACYTAVIGQPGASLPFNSSRPFLNPPLLSHADMQ
jgi:hypothetical protein